MQDLFKQLIQYECELHHRDRQNFQILDQRLHPDFKEITKSGRVLHKAQMIEALLNDTGTDIIQAQDFQVQSLSEHSVLLTYQSHQINVKTQAQYNVALRCSIWVLNDHGIWQMIPSRHCLYIREVRHIRSIDFKGGYSRFKTRIRQTH